PHAVFLARPGALSAPLEQPRCWGECVAAGFRPCGRIAVRLDIVERLAEALDAPEPPAEPQLARLIGRPARDLPAILGALGYHRVAAEAAPPRWRRPPAKRRRQPAAQPENAFSALANLLPGATEPPRRRKGRRR